MMSVSSKKSLGKSNNDLLLILVTLSLKFVVYKAAAAHSQLSAHSVNRKVGFG